MIQVTLSFTSVAAAIAALSKIPEADAAFATTTGVSAEEKAAVVQPGKPSAAKTAPSPRTAEAAPSTPAPSDAAPAPAPTTTQQTADAPSVTYPDLQKAVLTLHKRNPKAAQPIAQSLGADTFKLLKPEQWAEALRLVNEAIAAEDARV